MKTSIIGYPRVGGLRELKFATEKYFKGKITQEELKATAKSLREANWQVQKASGLDLIPSNDFSFYDILLDTANLFNIIPQRYTDLGLSELDTYFAQARGYQGEKGDVKALAMKKWFNTNYHYMVPEIEANTKIQLQGTKPFDEYHEAKALGIETKPVIVGPFTLLKLAKNHSDRSLKDLAEDLKVAYSAYLDKFAQENVSWLQFDEPYLVHDVDSDDIALLKDLYNEILRHKGQSKVLLQTYFGDIRDCYADVLDLAIDGIGLDFLEGVQSLSLVDSHSFPEDKILFAGLINGKNIWKNNYQKTLAVLDHLKEKGITSYLSTSCSLLHVPYSLKHENKLPEHYKAHFAFAEEKLTELKELSLLADKDYTNEATYQANQALFTNRPDAHDEKVEQRVAAIDDSYYTRLPEFSVREKVQKEAFHLPLFPTTTIGSFPQTRDVKVNRKAFRKNEITEEEYKAFNRQKIKDCIALQEEIGLDVLVHGEFERNDMVEYFGEHLNGYLFTEKAWVQSYGTRCVKPPIIWGDISRSQSITVEWSEYAQSLTKKPVKGMLTGPVTILNWSFPREDISVKESTLQIALAIRDEVLDLEAHGVKIIQVDEAALREKLPLRKSDWYKEYLDWAIPAFRIVHSGCQEDTQIHTHMCYSEFTDIIPAIDNMDADVITFEASRSDLQILDSLQANHFQTQVGPGVYDIHSPRVPSQEEIEDQVRKILKKVKAEKLWINPDCGLKTRGEKETTASLINLVKAAEVIRHEYTRSI
ncbi:5-methyltetrahydropteroyltriglutamate--homocysteine S-methyltransferase [Atopobacter sp. AH10]|uniref:5-methyltetrahydropteroyltriglutamate-- homocysteine S-methyltransferase n=1 Tax=Atopobacter sp. AH10 TaxID=2315861 RepID=UPI000EF26FFA|nr:5-methyltetrahydropteroyltriglutamate--homocysteine S-methyltransferase [Atopobacter sp. AH10]RLK62675.1 5-methyltetrahydropteroyltriglutamate--homocysteine S-methyltransferase [Atopobacter sp. AH10]